MSSRKLRRCRRRRCVLWKDDETIARLQDNDPSLACVVIPDILDAFRARRYGNALKHNTVVTKIELGGNSEIKLPKEKDALQVLLNFVSYSPSLKIFEMDLIDNDDFHELALTAISKSSTIEEISVYKLKQSTLSKFLRNTKSIQKLCLHCFQSQDTDELNQAMINSFRHNTSLQTLIVNGFQGSPFHFMKAVAATNTSIQELRLNYFTANSSSSSNILTDTLAVVFQSKSIQKLVCLGDCLLDDNNYPMSSKDENKFVNALSNNTHLQELELCSFLKASWFRLFAQGIMNHTNLQTLRVGTRLLNDDTSTRLLLDLIKQSTIQTLCFHRVLGDSLSNNRSTSACIKDMIAMEPTHLKEIRMETEIMQEEANQVFADILTPLQQKNKMLNSLHFIFHDQNVLFECLEYIPRLRGLHNLYLKVEFCGCSKTKANCAVVDALRRNCSLDNVNIRYANSSSQEQQQQQQRQQHQQQQQQEKQQLQQQQHRPLLDLSPEDAAMEQYCARNRFIRKWTSCPLLAFELEYFYCCEYVLLAACCQYTYRHEIIFSVMQSTWAVKRDHVKQ